MLGARCFALGSGGEGFRGVCFTHPWGSCSNLRGSQSWQDPSLTCFGSRVPATRMETLTVGSASIPAARGLPPALGRRLVVLCCTMWEEELPLRPRGVNSLTLGVPTLEAKQGAMGLLSPALRFVAFPLLWSLGGCLAPWQLPLELCHRLQSACFVPLQHDAGASGWAVAPLGMMLCAVSETEPLQGPSPRAAGEVLTPNRL